MKTPVIEKINSFTLMHQASQLVTKGQLRISNNRLVYLDVDDNYIHQLFPLLANSTINKPDYFGPGLAGAHISVIYPEEQIRINHNDLNSDHEFEIGEVFSAIIGQKKYYALAVNAPSLLQIRKQYGLPDMLPFKGYAIGLHITIGVQLISSYIL